MSKKERRRTRISGSVDKLPEGIRLQLDAKLMDTSNSYTDLALWLKEEGAPGFPGAPSGGCYPLQPGSTEGSRDPAAHPGDRGWEQRLICTRIIPKRPAWFDYGLMQRVSTAEEDFAEMPLDKAGRLIASLNRAVTYEKKVRQGYEKTGRALPLRRWKLRPWRRSARIRS